MIYRSSLLALISFIAIGNHFQIDSTKTHAQVEIKGHVRDSDKKPLAEAVLSLYACDPLSEKCGAPASLGRTGPDGEYIVNANELKPGRYSLEATLPPFFLPKAKVPVIIPGDRGRQFDFVMLADKRDAQGRLAVSLDDAREIYAAARINNNQDLEIASGRIVIEEVRNAQDKKPLFLPDGWGIDGVADNSHGLGSNGIPSSLWFAAVRRKTIEDAIDQDSILTDAAVNVDVNDKRIELKGTVPTKYAKEEAERIATESAYGLKVKNHLKVVSDPGSSKDKDDKPKD